jgi:hypothetical protein
MFTRFDADHSGAIESSELPPHSARND